MSFFSPIHHTFAPHVNITYVLRTVAILINPWKWRRGRSTTKLEQNLARRFNADTFLFSSGREALCALLRALNLENGEEVIVQGYTCIAVPNAIHAAGGVPVYVDIDRETLNLTTEEVEKVVTHRTRAVICQHTFGIPSPTQKLKALCEKHNIVLIEDCAHIMPDKTGPEEICKYGDFIFFSFGRDKAVSGITGGAVLSRKKEVSTRLHAERARAVHLSYFTILRLLTYPLVYFVARPFYGVKVGKAFLYFLKRIKWLVPVLTKKEKDGHQSPIPTHLSNAFAFLATGSFKKLHNINDHRRKLTKLYLEEGKKHNWPVFKGVTSDLPLQKFPLFIMRADKIREELKKRNIYLDDGWTGCVVCPASIDLDSTSYIPGSDPEAETACEQILTLPTHPTMSLGQAKTLCTAIGKLTK